MTKPKQKFIKKYGEHKYVKLLYYFDLSLTPTEVGKLLDLPRLVVFRWKTKLEKRTK